MAGKTTIHHAEADHGWLRVTESDGTVTYLRAANISAILATYGEVQVWLVGDADPWTVDSADPTRDAASLIELVVKGTGETLPWARAKREQDAPDA